MNYWNKLIGDEEKAGEYMLSYGEGPGFDTRLLVGEFINDGESVLDVGCGPGHNLEHFLEFGPALKRYKGVDYASFFVNAANKRRKGKQISTDYALPFELQDQRDLKEPDRSWDVVILQDCVEHTNGYEKPVKEALRVARKRIIVSFWHLTENDDHINDDGDDGYGAWYSKPKWEDFLNSMDYVWFDVEIHPEGKNHPWHFYVIEKEL